jgi:glyoxylase-like metal-dependent hydrolase (beta-lactamase superfamily II)
VLSVAVHGFRSGFCMHPDRMTIEGGSWKPRVFPSLVHLLVHPQEGPILFDTGYDQTFFAATGPFPERFYRWLTPVTLPPGERVTEQIKELGFAADDIVHVVLSHFHADHVAGLHAFGRAKIHCARAGLEASCSGTRLGRVRQGFLSALVPHDIERRLSCFEDRPQLSLRKEFHPFEVGCDVLGDGSLLAVELPGHCPGHWGLLLNDSLRGFHFLVADAAWSSAAIRENRPPPRVTTALLGDTALVRQTLSQLHELRKRNTDIVMTPSHCDECAAHAAPP